MVSAELRFSEFASSWQTKKLEDVSKVTSGGTPSRTITSYWNGDIPWITTSLIDFSNITFAEEFITEDGLKNSSAKLFKKGTLLVALYGQGVTRGKVATLGIDAATNQACAAIMLDETKLQSEFVFYSLQAKYETIRNLANDGGQKNLSGGLIKSIPISFPKLEEQQKIADFLSAVDEKIRLLKEKHALLQQYKKGVMQKLFSQEIRFKDDNGQVFPDWKTERVDYFVTRHSNSVNVVPDEIYREIGVRSHGKGVFHKSEITGRELGDKRVFWVHPNAFVVNIVFAWEHAVAQTSSDEQGFIASHRFPMYLPRDNRVDIRFFTLFFKTKRGKYLLELASPGGAGRNKTLGQSNFSELKITFPCVCEQKKIADFCEALDEKLDAVQQQIDLTQTFKKGLLQQMFV